MSKTILVPIDGSGPSRAAADYASEQFSGANITLLYVMDPMSEYSRRRAFPGYRAKTSTKTNARKENGFSDRYSKNYPTTSQLKPNSLPVSQRERSSSTQTSTRSNGS